MISDTTRTEAAEFHFAHCDAEDRVSPNHVCQGVVTITAATCSFDCSRCGHDRVNIRPHVEAIRDAAVCEKVKLQAFDKAMRESLEGFNQ
jgi:hypothetical protein